MEGVPGPVRRPVAEVANDALAVAPRPTVSTSRPGRPRAGSSGPRGEAPVVAHAVLRKLMDLDQKRRRDDHCARPARTARSGWPRPPMGRGHARAPARRSRHRTPLLTQRRAEIELRIVQADVLLPGLPAWFSPLISAAVQRRIQGGDLGVHRAIQGDALPLIGRVLASGYRARSRKSRSPAVIRYARPRSVKIRCPPPLGDPLDHDLLCPRSSPPCKTTARTPRHRRSGCGRPARSRSSLFQSRAAIAVPLRQIS